MWPVYLCSCLAPALMLFHSQSHVHLSKSRDFACVIFLTPIHLAMPRSFRQQNFEHPRGLVQRILASVRYELAADHVYRIMSSPSLSSPECIRNFLAWMDLTRPRSRFAHGLEL
ncbi:hypothetical protein BD626DRAFT_496245 [Schizophyllum amplum]|uniref:Secreted protein n=1 Tax=Schizophyllum amplum TaxID=97359 RepID=A0A550CEV5_9AGAR|nr:hypothetical protein BD626DRAFT_496245 [Auriculariopsis ampla]